jgi:hypothetical protein
MCLNCGDFIDPVLRLRQPWRRALRAAMKAMARHCEHWETGDGSCCRCGEPNWCSETGEDEAALQRYEDRANACSPG